MDRPALILRYGAGYDAVENSLVDITDDELDHRPAPHEWTAREIVHHLADSETTSCVRLRMLLATPNYVVQPYDQDEFAAHPKLRYPEHDAPYTVGLWLQIYADHPYDHADQIRAARRHHADASVAST